LLHDDPDFDASDSDEEQLLDWGYDESNGEMQEEDTDAKNQFCNAFLFCFKIFIIICGMVIMTSVCIQLFNIRVGQRLARERLHEADMTINMTSQESLTRVLRRDVFLAKRPRPINPSLKYRLSPEASRDGSVFAEAPADKHLIMPEEEPWGLVDNRIGDLDEGFVDDCGSCDNNSPFGDFSDIVGEGGTCIPSDTMGNEDLAPVDSCSDCVGRKCDSCTAVPWETEDDWNMPDAKLDERSPMMM